MLEILWGSLALSALVVSTALVALILAVRENVKKSGRSLDTLNQELPGILSALRQSLEGLEGLLSLGSRLKGWWGGLSEVIGIVATALGRDKK